MKIPAPSLFTVRFVLGATHAHQRPPKVMTSQTQSTRISLWVYGDVCRLFMRGLETLLPLKRKNMHRMLTEFIVLNPRGGFTGGAGNTHD